MHHQEQNAGEERPVRQSGRVWGISKAALAGVLLLGARKGKYGPNGQINAIPGCNLPLATLGTLILWLGWFGFNGGSELKVSSVEEANAVALVFVNNRPVMRVTALLASKCFNVLRVTRRAGSVYSEPWGTAS